MKTLSLARFLCVTAFALLLGGCASVPAAKVAVIAFPAPGVAGPIGAGDAYAAAGGFRE